MPTSFIFILFFFIIYKKLNRGAVGTEVGEGVLPIGAQAERGWKARCWIPEESLGPESNKLLYASTPFCLLPVASPALREILG